MINSPKPAKRLMEALYVSRGAQGHEPVLLWCYLQNLLARGAKRISRLDYRNRGIGPRVRCCR